MTGAEIPAYNVPMEDRISTAARCLARSSRTVASTGAGISKESGIPTFREADGLWNNYSPEQLATREGFLSDPGLVWRWYKERLLTARDRLPNPGHYALARLEGIIPHFLVITQNIDNLQQRAGSVEVVELHGNVERFRCMENSHYCGYDPVWTDEPPVCRCGSLIRPDVVWFGEPLPQIALEAAFTESARCDCFLVVGTSGTVQPAARLPLIARDSGAVIIEVNVTESAITPISDIFIMGRSGEILPRLVDLVEEYRPGQRQG